MSNPLCKALASEIQILNRIQTLSTDSIYNYHIYNSLLVNMNINLDSRQD